MHKYFLLLVFSLVAFSLTAADPARKIKKIDYVRDKAKLEYALSQLDMKKTREYFLEKHEYTMRKQDAWAAYKKNVLIPETHVFFLNAGIERQDARGNYVLKRNAIIALQKFRPKDNPQENDLLAKYYA